MEPFHLGIDVSKGYADFIMLNNNKQTEEQSFQLDDTFEGHQKLHSFLNQFFKNRPDAVVYAAVESTGGYENNWFSTLHKLQHLFPLKVARLNPRAVSHNSKAGLQRIITDKLSAKSIAEYMISHSEKIRYQDQDYFYPLRKKWNFIQALTKEKVKFLNQLEKLIYEANPELLGYCKDGTPQWLLKLLQLFPTAKQLKNASVQQVAQVPYISEKRAQKLITQAQLSIASADDELTADTIITLTTEILRLQQLIRQQVKLLSQHQSFPEIKLLKTFKSISDFTAIGLLIAMGPVQRFPSRKHIASFFGIHPVFKSSGDGVSGMHMSKQGSKQGRAILFMIALTAINHNPLIKETYIRNRTKGKTKMDAIGVCMHKILRITYGMLKNNQPFDPEIDRAHQRKCLEKKIVNNNDKLRRFQQPDKAAPVSRRQHNKRKERVLSQNERIVMNGINFPPLSLN
jgi:transposase